jgi:predicted nuclease with TOPRIM domain
MVHRLQKEQVSLSSALSDKRAELEALKRTADPEQLEEMQAELAQVERSSKERNDEVASQRKRLSKLQAQQEKEQEVMEALQRRLVRSVPH